MRVWTSAAVLALAVSCAKPAPPAPPPPAGPAEDLITTASMTEHIKTLASDEFGGRAPATPGGVKTVEYLAKQLTDLGIEPGAPDGTFFQ